MIAGDLDVFVLLIYYYHTSELAYPMYMISPVRERASTDIAETTARIKDIAGYLPAIHALSGYDTTAATYDIRGNQQQSKWQRGENPCPCPLWVMSPPISVTLHHKQQNSSQDVMVNTMRGALQWQNVGRKYGPTKLEEEKLRPPNFVHPHNISYISSNVKRCHYPVFNWKSALLPDPHQWVQLNLVGKQTYRTKFVGTKPSRCNCTGTWLHL